MSEVTTDHDAIRKWAEQHGGKPAAVDRTHADGDVGIIRIMFPKAAQSEHSHLIEIGWDEFLSEFEKRKLALVFDPKGMFSKIIGRDTAEQRMGDHDAARPGHQQQSRRDPSDDSSGYSLKEREYRDSEGNVHHHTNAYMEQHGKK